MKSLKMNNIWLPIKKEIETYISNNISHNIESVFNLQKNLQPILKRYEFINKKELPFGRYLVFKDKGNKFNIQIDVFSLNYIGKIHCHKTWGILHVFKGLLFVEDWEESKKEKFIMRGGLALDKGSSQSFCPPISDWHKVSSSKISDQAISMHIYGNGFNIDKGIYLETNLKPQEGKRSDFKNLSLLEKYIKINKKL